MAAFPEGHRDSVRTWRQYRQEKSAPVIIITAREEETDAVLSLELAIAKALVEAHDGRIEVSADVGKGTTFTIWLPIYPRNLK